MNTERAETSILQSVTAHGSACEARISSALGLFEALTDPVLVCDQNNFLVDLNPAAENFFGFSLAEVRHQPITVLIGENNLEFLDVGRQPASQAVVPLRTRNGELKQVELAVGAPSSQDQSAGQTLKIIVAKSTAAIEGAAHTENLQLEEALRTRTNELLLASRRKDEFLALLSHELRNPLAPIANSLAIMRTFHIADPMIARSRSIIERQFEHLSGLVDDLLDVARVSNGKIVIAREPVTLDLIVERAIEISHPRIAMASHTLKVSLPPEPVHLEGDPMRLSQALSNILSNAAKFTPQGGTITLSCHHGDGEVFISVRDNGAGISKEFKPRLFELFAQADASLARTQSGLGIGLAIAHEIVRLHEGRIEVSSAGIGAGSEFVVILPAAAPSAPLPEPKPSGEAGITDNRSFRILLIDDNHDANESMCTLLRLLNYDVRTAKDARSALKVAAEFLPHMILSDIGLPEMDGYQLAPELRKAVGPRKLILAAATGYGLASDRMRSQAAGFDYHLVKPLDADALLDFVAQQVANY